MQLFGIMLISPLLFVKAGVARVDMNERLFLGIRSSATGMKWVDRLGLREANTALAIA